MLPLLNLDHIASLATDRYCENTCFSQYPVILGEQSLLKRASCLYVSCLCLHGYKHPHFSARALRCVIYLCFLTLPILNIALHCAVRSCPSLVPENDLQVYILDVFRSQGCLASLVHIHPRNWNTIRTIVVRLIRIGKRALSMGMKLYVQPFVPLFGSAQTWLLCNPVIVTGSGWGRPVIETESQHIYLNRKPIFLSISVLSNQRIADKGRCG